MEGQKLVWQLDQELHPWIPFWVHGLGEGAENCASEFYCRLLPLHIFRGKNLPEINPGHMFYHLQ